MNCYKCGMAELGTADVSGICAGCLNKLSLLPSPSVWVYGLNAEWQLCPVCKGKGKMRRDFYEEHLQYPDCEERVDCKACNGKGIVK